MADTKYKKPRKPSVKQLEAKEYRLYQCKNCKWSNMKLKHCNKADCSIVLVRCCKHFEVKLSERDCTQCKYFNSRKNANTYCKIGIYNCKGVIKNG